MKRHSIKQLVKQYGLGVWVAASPPKYDGITGEPFQVVEEAGEQYYNCLFPGYGYQTVLRECEETNDYVKVDK